MAEMSKGAKSIAGALTILVCCLGLSGSMAHAQALFFEDFESDLSQWIGKLGGSHHGMIVADPLRPGNHVLTFTALNSAGDMFGTPVSVVPGVTYILSFEYLGLPGSGGTPGNLGAIVGMAEDTPGAHRWLAGTSVGNGVEADLLIDDGQWRSYRIEFNPYESLAGCCSGYPLTIFATNAIRLMLEDFDGAGGVAGDVFFDNIRLSPKFTEVTALSDAHLWVGLKNSDDQGTQFDLMVELLHNGTPVASGLTRCIKGVTSNPARATEAIVPWSPLASVPLSSGDVLALKVSARIGTTSTGAKCGGPGGSHSSATGLRLYYDSARRPSRFDATIAPTPSEDFDLHSDGTVCPGGGGNSTAVTTRFLDTTAATATNAKCKDSGGVSFAGGNLFKEIGTWSLAPLP